MTGGIFACAIALLLLTASSCAQDRESGCPDCSETRGVRYSEWIKTQGESDKLPNLERTKRNPRVSEPVSKPVHREMPFDSTASNKSKDLERLSEEHHQPTDNGIYETTTPQAMADSAAVGSIEISNVDIRFIVVALSLVLLLQIATGFLTWSVRKQLFNNTAVVPNRELEFLRHQFEDERQSLLKEISGAQDASRLAAHEEQEKKSKLFHEIEKLSAALNVSLAEQQRLSDALVVSNRELAPQQNSGDVSYNSTVGLPKGFVNDSVIGNIITTGAAGFMDR